MKVSEKTNTQTYRGIYRISKFWKKNCSIETNIFLPKKLDRKEQEPFTLKSGWGKILKMASRLS